jgi:nucleoside-diphosphate kinase
MVTRTLAIIKPDAVEGALIGRIVDRIEEDGRLKVTGLKWEQLTDARAREFYAEHDGRPYFEKLIRFMTSGPCVAMALESKDPLNAVARWRGILADLRGRYANPERSECNCVHGSDSAESALRELSFFGLL